MPKLQEFSSIIFYIQHRVEEGVLDEFIGLLSSTRLMFSTGNFWQAVGDGVLSRMQIDFPIPSHFPHYAVFLTKFISLPNSRNGTYMAAHTTLALSHALETASSSNSN